MNHRFNRWGCSMRGTRLRSAVKSVVAVLCAACFLTVGIGTVSRAVAADTFETWPKKTVEPGVEPRTDATGAAKAGEEGGTKTATGLSGGTIGWIALGTAALIGIAVAAGSGGGGGGGSTTPAHP
jgi:hypothetical protein